MPCYNLISIRQCISYSSIHLKPINSQYFLLYFRSQLLSFFQDLFILNNCINSFFLSVGLFPCVLGKLLCHSFKKTNYFSSKVFLLRFLSCSPFFSLTHQLTLVCLAFISSTSWKHPPSSLFLPYFPFIFFQGQQ